MSSYLDRLSTSITDSHLSQELEEVIERFTLASVKGPPTHPQLLKNGRDCHHTWLGVKLLFPLVSMPHSTDRMQAGCALLLSIPATFVQFQQTFFEFIFYCKNSEVSGLSLHYRLAIHDVDLILTEFKVWRNKLCWLRSEWHKDQSLGAQVVCVCAQGLGGTRTKA